MDFWGWERENAPTLLSFVNALVQWTSIGDSWVHPYQLTKIPYKLSHESNRLSTDKQGCRGAGRGKTQIESQFKCKYYGFSFRFKRKTSWECRIIKGKYLKPKELRNSMMKSASLLTDCSRCRAQLQQAQIQDTKEDKLNNIMKSWKYFICVAEQIIQSFLELFTNRNHESAHTIFKISSLVCKKQNTSRLLKTDRKLHLNLHILLSASKNYLMHNEQQSQSYKLPHSANKDPL